MRNAGQLDDADRALYGHVLDAKEIAVKLKGGIWGRLTWERLVAGELPSARPPPDFKQSPAKAGESGSEGGESTPQQPSSALYSESFFSHAAIRQTVDALMGAVTAGGGTILLTGDPGTGKTMIVKRLERELRSAGCTVAGFDCADMASSNALVRTLSNDLGIAPAEGRIDRWLQSFHRFASKLNKSGAPIVLLIDGAEHLSSDLRRRLGQLVNPAAAEPGGLRLILAGRPEILGHPELQPDRDLGRSIRVDRRLERLADKHVTGLSAIPLEHVECSGRDISPGEPCGVAASGAPSAAARLTGRRLTFSGRCERDLVLQQRLQFAPARLTGRIRTASYIAAGYVIAGSISVIAAVGGWIMAENSRQAARLALPAAGLAQSGGISGDRASGPPRAIVPEAVRLGWPAEVGQGDSGSASDEQFRDEARSGAGRLPDSTVAALLTRGDELLALGDFSDARLLYERAAMGGSARAARAAGETYDPIYLKDTGMRGPRPEAVKALAWYRRAIELGDSEAVARLKKLEFYDGPLRRESTGPIDDKLGKVVGDALGLAAKAALDLKMAAENSKSAKLNFDHPLFRSMPFPRPTGSDVASQLAAKIKGSNLGDQQKMIIHVASVLGAAEFCLGQGVDYRELAEPTIAGWRSNSPSDDLLTQMSINCGLQIGHQGIIYDFHKSTIIDLAGLPNPESGCNDIYREAVQVSQSNKNPPSSPAPAPPAAGLAQSGGISGDRPSEPPRAMVLEAARLGWPVEVAQGDSGSGSDEQVRDEARSGAGRLPDSTVAAILTRGDELLALGDLSAARLLYERAAMGGSARAARAAGETYDPIYLKDTGMRGPRPEAAKALAWYHRAIELGDSEAVARLKKLQALGEH